MLSKARQRHDVLMQGHPAVHRLLPEQGSQRDHGVRAAVAHADGHQGRLPDQRPASAEDAQVRRRPGVHAMPQGAGQEHCVLR